MLDKAYYYNPGHFEIENDLVFSKNWVFACLLEEVQGNNEFVTLDIAKIPVVIQNFKGELRAFKNVCSHRFNKIQIEDFGRRALTCGYHCWSFDKDGYPSFIPKKELFQEFKNDEFVRNEFCLERFHLEICGNFVFILLSETKEVELKDYLGNHYDKMVEISSHMGKKIHFGGLKHQANWKILIENVLECYHCSVVHKESLYGKLGIGNLPITDIEFSDAHSSCHFPKVARKSDEKKKKILSFLDTRSFIHDSFYHIFIFPNLVVSSTEGASFYVGQLFPLAAGETELKVRFLEPKLNYENVNEALRDILAEESVKLGYEILEEDKFILENIQKGIQKANGTGIINDEEVRIKYFFEKYKSIIKN